PAILRGSWLVLSKPTYQELYRASTVVEAARASFTLAGKTTRIGLDTNENLDLFDDADYRDAMVFAQSEYLEIAEEPIADPITGAQVELAISSAGLIKGQRLAASGKDSVSGETISEVVTISDISAAMIIVTPALAKSYARESFLLNAN